MTIEEIRELIKVVNESGIAELEVQRGDNRVRIRRTGRDRHMGFTPVDAQPALSASPPQPAPTTTPPPIASVAPTPPPNNELLVRSPIVGTFYESSAPGNPPFVRIGETVQPGSVLCIIESMKLMNEIEAEVSGVVTSKLVANGQPVEYGEALFGIRPL